MTDHIKFQFPYFRLLNHDFEFNGLESLSGKTVGTVRKYGYGDAFLNAKNFNRFENNELVQNLKMLSKHRIDLTLEDEIVARHIIFNDAPELKDKLTFTKNSLSSQTLHVTSGLKNPKNKAIIASFNKGLAVIKRNGTYEDILKNYGLR